MYCLAGTATPETPLVSALYSPLLRLDRTVNGVLSLTSFSTYVLPYESARTLLYGKGESTTEGRARRAEDVGCIGPAP